MPLAEDIAAPDTVLGLVQRGRGEGYRRILNIPRTEAQALLIQCISRDLRMDSQVESRDEYYASIAIEIELPLEPLAEHLRQNDDPSQNSWATPLTVTTLTELAKRGYRNAGEILCDYIAWGQWWDWPIEDLRSLPGDRLAPRIASALEQHFPTKEMLDKAMQTWPTKQFLNLSRFSTRIEASLSKASTKTIVDSPRDLTSLTPVGLLALADEKNFHALGKAMAEVVGPANIDLLVSHVSLERPFVASVALAGLTKLAPLALSAWLPEFWLTIPESNPGAAARNRGFIPLRHSVKRAIVAWPPEATLPLARDWMHQEDFRKRDLAEKILQSHATPSDIPLLRAALRPMLTDEEAEWDCFIIQAFYNLPGTGIVPELIEIFRHFRFSMGRAYAAKAIQITSPEFFAENLALECLWDCEESTRELGVKCAPLQSPDALQRIQYLAEDPFEGEEIRHAATARLECTTSIGVERGNT